MVETDNMDSSNVDAPSISLLAQMGKLMLAWDFDWTLVDGNSDPWVVKKIGAGHIFKECTLSVCTATVLVRMMSRVREIGFTRVMDETLRRAHLSLGYTQADIFNACATVPMHPSLLQAC